MRCYCFILGLVLLTTVRSFAQEEFTKHTVTKGETITQIAAQYSITISAIYEINPDARAGIKSKSVLLIPATVRKSGNATSDPVIIPAEINHTALPKETLYAIGKQYGVTVEDLYNTNPGLQQSGLRKGDRIIIPRSDVNLSVAASVDKPLQETKKNRLQKLKPAQNKDGSVVLNLNEPNGFLSSSIELEIAAHDTKYSIAKQYNITIAALNVANPILEREALKIGQKIIIPKTNWNDTQVAVNQIEVKKESENLKPVVIKESILIDKVEAKNVNPIIIEPFVSPVVLETSLIREVLAKETKYGIAKEYGISVKELERQNPKIVKGLTIGFKLNIRSNKPIEAPEIKNSSELVDQGGDLNKQYILKSFHGTDFLDQLVSAAAENIGSRYRIGGTTKDGFDCSGLMFTTFGAFDIQLPRTSLEQSQFGVKIENEDAQKGDLIFFKTNSRRQINHVGMVVEAIDGDIKFIHASVSGGVMISSIKEKYYKKKVSQVNRVL
jgi:LysM repeat protein